MRPRPDAMRPRSMPRPERVRPRLRPNDSALRPYGPWGLNIPGVNTRGRKLRNCVSRVSLHADTTAHFKQHCHDCNAKHKVWPVATQVVWSACVCWWREWALQKWLNWSRCQFGVWTHRGPRREPASPMGRSTFGIHTWTFAHRRYSQPYSPRDTSWMWLLTTYAKANYSEYTVQQTVNSQDIQKRYTSKKSSEMVWAGGMKRKLNSKKKYKSS